MIIVPELKTVFVLVPRTGSGTLYRELMRVYPRSMLLYRHMEADGVPQGYDRWRRIGFVRHPLTRLWSLYCFMQTFGGGAQLPGFVADVERAQRQVAGKSFAEWLETNCEPWTMATDVNGDGHYWPLLSRTNAAPENKISQWNYLRPDLGTEIRKFEYLRDAMVEFGLDPDRRANTVGSRPAPDDIGAGVPHTLKFCQWDLEQGCSLT